MKLKMFIRKTLSVLLVGSMFAMSSASIVAAQGEPVPAPPAEETQIDSTSQEAATAPELFAVFSPVLPFEPGGVGFAQVGVINFGGATPEGSVVGFQFGQLPQGVSIKSVEPKASTASAGWACNESGCRWVKLTPAGQEIAVSVSKSEQASGRMILDIAAENSLAKLSDAQLENAGKAVSNLEEGQLVDEVTPQLTEVPFSALLNGSPVTSALVSNATMAVTTEPGRERIATWTTGIKPSYPRELVDWTIEIGSIGGASVSTLNLGNIVPSGSPLQVVSAQGDGWLCEDLRVCRITKSLAPGTVSGKLNVQVQISDSANVGDVIEWNFDIQGPKNSGSPTNALEIKKADAPDLQFKLTSTESMAMRGDKIPLEYRIITTGGPALSGVSVYLLAPYADFVSGENCSAVTKSMQFDELLTAYQSSSGSTEESDSTNASVFDQNPAFIKCDVAALAQGKEAIGSLVISMREDLPTPGSTNVLALAVDLSGMEDTSQGANTATATFIVPDHNTGLGVISQAEKTESGRWEPFSGSTVRLSNGETTEVAYVVENRGAGNFEPGQQFEIQVALPEGVRAKAQSVSAVGWQCSAGEVDAVPASEALRAEASKARVAAGVDVTEGMGYSKLEESVLAQLNTEAATKPIAEVSGKVAGLNCTYKSPSAMSPDGATPPLVLTLSGTLEAGIISATLLKPDVKDSQPVIVQTIVVGVPSSTKGLRTVFQAGTIRPGGVGALRFEVFNESDKPAGKSALLISGNSAIGVGKIAGSNNAIKCASLGSGLSIGVIICSANELDANATTGIITGSVRAGSSWKSGGIEAMLLSSDGVTKFTNASFTEKPALSIALSAIKEVHDESISPQTGEVAPTQVSLAVAASPDGQVYVRQRCIVEGDTLCGGALAKPVEIKRLSRTGYVFDAPNVDSPTPLQFEAVIADGDAIATSLVTVNVVPKPAINMIPKQNQMWSAAGQSLNLSLVYPSQKTAEPRANEGDPIGLDEPWSSPKWIRAAGAVSANASVLTGSEISVVAGETLNYLVPHLVLGPLLTHGLCCLQRVASITQASEKR